MHACRFTARSQGVQAAYQYPATHLVTGSGGTNAGWMGMRARLQGSFDCTSRMKTQAARVICQALKKTGMILADVGTSWFLTGEASPLWQSRLGADYDQFLTDIKAIKGSDVQVVVPPTGERCACWASQEGMWDARIPWMAAVLLVMPACRMIAC